MTYDDIEKFALENEDLARAIANFKCNSICCDDCVFHVEMQETRCLSSTLWAMINVYDLSKNKERG